MSNLPFNLKKGEIISFSKDDPKPSPAENPEAKLDTQRDPMTIVKAPLKRGPSSLAGQISVKKKKVAVI